MKYKVKCYKQDCGHEWITKQYGIIICCSKCQRALVKSKLIRLGLISEVKEE